MCVAGSSREDWLRERRKAGLDCGLVNSHPPRSECRSRTTKSRGVARELISRGNDANVDLIGREWPGEVVWGVEEQQADIPHGEHGNVLGSGEVLGARGAPGDYSQGEETEDYRQTECAGLQGKREGRVLICREILNKGLCRNSHREHAQWRLIGKVVGPSRSTDTPGFTYNSPKLMGSTLQRGLIVIDEEIE